MQDLLEDIAAMVSGASEPGIQLALLWAAERFCRRSRIWALRRSGVLNAALEVSGGPVPGGVPFDISELVVAGRRMGVVAEAPGVFLSVHPQSVVTARVAGDPPVEVITAPDSFSAGDEAVWIAAFLPRQWDSLPAELASRYRQVLMDGALAHLHRLPGTPHFDPTAARAYGYAFEAATKSAGMRRGHGPSIWASLPFVRPVPG